MDHTLVALGSGIALAGLGLFAGDPAGVVAVGLVLVAVGLVVDAFETDALARTNCPECGAPNEATVDVCGYCEHAPGE